MEDQITVYIALLKRELLARGFSDRQDLLELESHLREAVDLRLERGLNPAEAQQLALEKFGTAECIADQFEKESNSMKQKILFAAAFIAGLLIAFVDSRPTWDDTGITVFALLLGGGIIGLLVRKHPWLFALAFGIWIPLLGVLVKHDLTMSIVFLFPLAGVYAGWALRWLSRKVLHSA